MIAEDIDLDISIVFKKFALPRHQQPHYFNSN